MFSGRKTSENFTSQQQKKWKLPLPAFPKDLKAGKFLRNSEHSPQVFYPQQRQTHISFKTLPNEKY